MSDKAKIVMWLGIAMIALQLVKDWPTLKQIFFDRQAAPNANSTQKPIINKPIPQPKFPHVFH